MKVSAVVVVVALLEWKSACTLVECTVPAVRRTPDPSYGDTKIVFWFWFSPLSHTEFQKARSRDSSQDSIGSKIHSDFDVCLIRMNE